MYILGGFTDCTPKPTDLVFVLDESKSVGPANFLLQNEFCLLYTSDAADDMQCVDLGGRRIIKKSH